MKKYAPLYELSDKLESFNSILEGIRSEMKSPIECFRDQAIPHEEIQAFLDKASCAWWDAYSHAQSGVSNLEKIIIAHTYLQKEAVRRIIHQNIR